MCPRARGLVLVAGAALVPAPEAHRALHSALPRALVRERGGARAEVGAAVDDPPGRFWACRESVWEGRCAARSAAKIAPMGRRARRRPRAALTLLRMCRSRAADDRVLLTAEPP